MSHKCPSVPRITGLAKLLKLVQPHTYPAHIEKFRQNPGFLGHWDISGTLVFQLFTATRRKGDVHTFPSLSILVCDHVCAATTFARRLYGGRRRATQRNKCRLCIVQSMFVYISHDSTNFRIPRQDFLSQWWAGPPTHDDPS